MPFSYNPKEFKKTLRKHRPKKHKEPAEILDVKQSAMFDPDGYLYPKYAIAKTTWAYCWRCGEKIAINHTTEIATGIHKECNNTFEYNKFYPFAIHLQIG